MQKILNFPKIKKLNKEFSPTIIKTVDFNIISVIGTGSFGKVFKVYSKQKNSFFALKVLSQNQITKLKLWSQLLKEIEILSICDHENIIKLYAVFSEQKKVYMLLELANENCLFTELEKKKKINENRISEIIKDVLKALDYLHSLNPPVLHRDLKPENILIHNKKIKIADFGWSNQKDNFRNTFCGTPDYLSPEMILGTGHNEKLDIWSVGVLMYELLHGITPFRPQIQIRDVLEKQRNIEDNILNGNFDVDKNASNAILEVFDCVLKPDPRLRPSAKELMNFEFFKIFNENKLSFEQITLRGFCGIVKPFSKLQKKIEKFKNVNTSKSQKIFEKINNDNNTFSKSQKKFEKYNSSKNISNNIKKKSKKEFLEVPKILINSEIKLKTPKKKNISISSSNNKSKDHLIEKKVSNLPYFNKLKNKNDQKKKKNFIKNITLAKSQRTLKFDENSNKIKSFASNNSQKHKTKKRRDYEFKIENLKLLNNNVTKNLKITKELLKKEQNDKIIIKKEKKDLKKRIKELEINLIKKNEKIFKLKTKEKKNLKYFSLSKKNLEDEKRINDSINISNKINNFFINYIKKNNLYNNKKIYIKENSYNNLLANENLNNNNLLSNNITLYQLDKIFEDFIKKEKIYKNNKNIRNNFYDGNFQNFCTDNFIEKKKRKENRKKSVKKSLSKAVSSKMLISKNKFLSKNKSMERTIFENSVGEKKNLVEKKKIFSKNKSIERTIFKNIIDKKKTRSSQKKNFIN